MPKPLKIVVAGYIIGYPLGGMTWHHLNYLLGFHELGHEVCFFEDSGDFCMPYNPSNWTSSPDSTYGRDYLKQTFDRYGLPLRYCYYSQFEDRYYGMQKPEFEQYLRDADCLVCVSGVTPLRPERPRARRMVVIDTDPVFTQLRMRHDRAFLGYYRLFDTTATFGRLIGTPACPLPTHGLDWVPTNQPISLRHWPVKPAASRAFTTIGKWEHSGERHMEFNGQRFHSGKGVEWLKMQPLPRRVPWGMRLGMAGMPRETADSFAACGWTITDPEKASLSCQAYQDFIIDSAGEFTVAKEIYAGLPSGWFSDRSSAYLAAGRPVVTQDSGFDHWLPAGEGLFSFKTIDDAAHALNTIADGYPRHAAAARAIAEQYLDAGKVLNELLARTL
jgi:hypothetical protein